MIRNEATGLEVPFNSVQIQDGETITVDFRPRRKLIRSTLRGVVSGAIREGGDFQAWSLRKGAQDVSFFVHGANAATAIDAGLVWRERFSTIDGVQS
jgi:hypothetical protein